MEDLKNEAKQTLNIYCEAFSYGGQIPKKYTCDGENVPPPITWGNVPQGIKSFVIIMYDPDAPGGTFIHWILFNIPPTVTSISEENADKVGVKGRNDFGRLGYGGPCPPPGSTHRYFIIVFALDTQLNLKEGVKLSAVLEAMKGHVIAYGEYMGKYRR